jgi:hypothetical protein
VDSDHKLRIVGNLNTSVVDHTHTVLPAVDDTQAGQAGSYCVFAASDRTFGSLWLFVGAHLSNLLCENR